MTNDCKNNMAADLDTRITGAAMSKTRIKKNILVLCVGAFILFTAYDGPTMLQSSMNKEIGVAALAINYACFCISALLFPKYFIKRYGSKTTFVLSMALYIPYIASNYYPHWAVMIPVSVLIGFSAALLWSSQATYLNDVSVVLAKQSMLKKENNAHHLEVTGHMNYSKNLEAGVLLSEPEVRSTNNIFSQDCKNSKTEIDASHLLSPDALKSDKDRGIRTISENFIWSISEKIKEEAIQRRTSDINIFEFYQTNTMIGLTFKKFQELFRNKVESITARVFGIHGMAFLLSHLSGNLLAYFILKKGVDAPNVFINSTCAQACGANYCNANSNCLSNDLEEVSDTTRIILTTVCLCLAVISVLIVALFLEPLETESKEAPFSLQFLMATYEIAKRTDLILLIPYTLYLGQIQGFFTGEFNKAYVSCAWGTYHVSLVSISYGFFCAVFATSSGWIVKFFGRKLLFFSAAILNIAFSVLLLLWKPMHPEMFFTSAGMIGAFVGMIWSQLRAFYGVLFKAEEEAFHVRYSIGFCLSFAYSAYFCTSIKIYVLLFVSNIGYVGYFIVERRFCKFKNKCGTTDLN